MKDDPWEGAGRFAGDRNTGPGAAVTPDRPQFTDEQAAGHVPERCLGGRRP
ncbi:hypothetical protein [Nonomuraea sp. KM90]|uniref:hypothetical protein n=1 Tax=Nonomuraea sp. KM90 TaxID=3457428 RepID=UPI003FCDD5EB